jgi:outer membrane autotransporter protein
MSTNRTIAVVAADTLNASFNAQNFGGRLEAGVVAWSMPFQVIPYAAVQAQSFRSAAYSETGSLAAPDPFALSFAAQTATAVRSELGSRFNQVFAQADGSSVDLFSRAAWAHDWQSNPNLTATFIGLPAATFVVNGAAPPKDLALVTSGAEWRWRNGWAIMGKFDGEFARGARTYTGTAKASYTW